MNFFNQDHHTPVLPAIIALAVIVVILLNIYMLIQGI